MEEEVFAIVGCGMFGLSTALELAREKKKVICFDAYPIPSPISAGNDLNKIIRIEYSDLDYTRLAIEALDGWRKDPIYKNHYYECGRFTLTPTATQNQNRSEFEQKGIDNLKTLGRAPEKVSFISSREELSKIAPEFSQVSLDPIDGKYNSEAGFAHAAHAMESAYRKCVEIGVEFRFGSVSGRVVKVLEGSVVTEGGEITKATKILICSGANIGYILPLEKQVSALGLFLTHIKLTDEEYAKYENMPIFFSSEKGYFFPPDRETHLMKIALTYAQATNKLKTELSGYEDLSLPRYKIEYDADTMPIDGEYHARKLLLEVVPDLAEHEFTGSKVCWIGDTFDSNFVIDKHPDFSGSVFVAMGDSGHAFKFMPNIGKYVVQRMNECLEEPWAQKWRWKGFPKWPERFEWRTERVHYELKDVKFVTE